MRIAILDLGTNTFNLLIVDAIDNKFSTVLKEKIPVKLGAGGINNNIIDSQTFKRGIDSFVELYKYIKKNNCDIIRAIATSAIRTADNGKLFIKEVYEKTGINIEVISGEKEAEYIFKGVRNTINFSNEDILVLDIGGGSNEFIVANGNNIILKRSYKLGIARLLDLFKPEDRISENTILKINTFLEAELSHCIDGCLDKNITKLIGSSGAFNTIASLIFVHKNMGKMKNLSNKLLLDDFYSLYDVLVKSSLEERRNMEGMPLFRAEMIVVAMIFIKFIIEKFNIKELYQSRYALKEGVIFDILDNNHNYEQTS